MKFLFKFIVLATIININNLFSRVITEKKFSNAPSTVTTKKTKFIEEPTLKPSSLNEFENVLNDPNFPAFSEFFDEKKNFFEEIVFLKAVLDVAKKNGFLLTFNEDDQKKLNEAIEINKKSYLKELEKSNNEKYLGKNHFGLIFKIKELVESININLIEKSRFFSKKTPSNFFKELFNNYKNFIKKSFKNNNEDFCMQEILQKMKENFNILSDSIFILDVISNVTVKDSTKSKIEQEILNIYNKIFSLINKIYDTNIKIKKKKFDVSLMWEKSKNFLNKSKKPLMYAGTAVAIYGASALAEKYGSDKVKSFGGAIYRNTNKAGKKTASFGKSAFKKGKEKISSAGNWASQKTKNLSSRFKKNKIEKIPVNNEVNQELFDESSNSIYPFNQDGEYDYSNNPEIESYNKILNKRKQIFDKKNLKREEQYSDFKNPEVEFYNRILDEKNLNKETEDTNQESHEAIQNTPIYDEKDQELFYESGKNYYKEPEKILNIKDTEFYKERSDEFTNPTQNYSLGKTGYDKEFSDEFTNPEFFNYEEEQEPIYALPKYIFNNKN